MGGNGGKHQGFCRGFNHRSPTTQGISSRSCWCRYNQAICPVRSEILLVQIRFHRNHGCGVLSAYGNLVQGKVQIAKFFQVWAQSHFNQTALLNTVFSGYKFGDHLSYILFFKGGKKSKPTRIHTYNGNSQISYICNCPEHGPIPSKTHKHIKRTVQARGLRKHAMRKLG